MPDICVLPGHHADTGQAAARPVAQIAVCSQDVMPILGRLQPGRPGGGGGCSSKDIGGWWWLVEVRPVAAATMTVATMAVEEAAAAAEAVAAVAAKCERETDGGMCIHVAGCPYCAGGAGSNKLGRHADTRQAAARPIRWWWQQQQQGQWWLVVVEARPRAVATMAVKEAAAAVKQLQCSTQRRQQWLHSVNGIQWGQDAHTVQAVLAVNYFRQLKLDANNFRFTQDSFRFRVLLQTPVHCL